MFKIIDVFRIYDTHTHTQTQFIHRGQNHHILLSIFFWCVKYFFVQWLFQL